MRRPFLHALARLRRLSGRGALAGACALAVAPSTQAASVFVDELTSPELQQRVAAGATTVLVPIGGTEQNGAHMVLGKHNVRAQALAARIAARLGNALVAPVVAYVPEGSIDPPTAHMRYAGTISIPEGAFESLLEGAARSFCRHGLRDVVFLGDHGGYQRNEQRVAAKLNREWTRGSGCRAHALAAYYDATQTRYVDALKQRGFSSAEIGTHAGLADTALALAVDPALVRADALARAPKPGDGTAGDPRRATAEVGRAGADAVVESSVSAIQAAIRQSRGGGK
jgi:creatinine amidohydrolase/Fe(II)-dependent formamide hydrolase-like protein